MVISDSDSCHEKSAVGATYSPIFMFKEKSLVLETELASRTRLRNPREASRFIPRIAMKIPYPKAGKCGVAVGHAGTAAGLNESPRPKAGK